MFRTITSRSISESGIFDLTALTTRCACQREDRLPSGNLTTMMSLPDGRGISVTNPCLIASLSVGPNRGIFGRCRMGDDRHKASFQRRRYLTKVTYTELTTQQDSYALHRYGPIRPAWIAARLLPAACLHQPYSDVIFGLLSALTKCGFARSNTAD